MVSYVKVKQILVQRIGDGTWPEGTRLPTERSLVEDIGASRNTIRKAIRALATEKYVSISDHARPVVLRDTGPTRETHLQDVRGESEKDGQEKLSQLQNGSDSLLSGDDYIRNSSPLEVLEARLVVEPEAVALATLRARSDNIEEIRKALHESLSAQTLEDFEYWDGRLHQCIFQATRNTTLIGYYETLNQIRNQPSWIALKKKSVTADRRQLYNEQHTAIVEAIVDRQPDQAKVAMRVHLESVRNAMMG